MRYLLILIIALSVGVACALPNILGYLEFKEKYEPFSHLFSSDTQLDETTFYAPAASYFKEKLSLPFAVDIYEYRNKPTLRYLLPDIVEGAIGYLFKDLRLAWGFMHFIFPLISFLLVYLLAKELTDDSLVACFSAVVFCTLGCGPRSFMNLYKENIAQPVLFSRISPPAVTLPFLLIALIGLVKIQKRHFKIGIVLAGIFGGLLFYVYYYYQATYILTLILLTLVYMMIKKWDKFFRILLIGIIVNIVALPWYVQNFYTRKLNSKFILHLSTSFSNPSFFGITCILIFVSSLIISYLLWKPGRAIDKNKFNKFLDSGYLPIYTFILTAIFIQVLSYFISFVIWPGHLLQRITNGFSLLVISCIIGNRLSLHSPVYKFLIFISICILIVLLFIKQTNVWQSTKRYFQANPLERIAEKLICKHTTPEDVIGINDPFLNSVFASRIWRFRFYTPLLGNIDWQENVCRYLFMQKIFNRPWEYVDRKFLPEPDTELPPLKVITIPSLLGSSRQYFTTGEGQELSKFYKSLSRAFLDTKKIDYLLCLSSEDEKDLLLGAEKLGIDIYLIERNSNVALYKVKNQKIESR